MSTDSMQNPGAGVDQAALSMQRNCILRLCQMSMNHLRNARFWILAIVSAFYAYGALVHVLNILDLSGFDWSSAPTKWQVLDAVYLLLDVTVCIGLVRRLPISIVAFYTAGLSQAVLYTLLRSWIMDVPEPFTITPDQASYLTLLVIFHVATLILVTYALRGKAGASSEHPDDT